MKVGTDPEYFLKSLRTGRYEPAHRVFPDKNNPMALGHGMKVFRDGYAVELNVPPQNDPAVLMLSVMEAIATVNNMVARDGLRLASAATVPIDLREDLDGAPDDVLHFGCEPSYCAYTGRTKIPQINAWEHPWRYAGAHMHFSLSPDEQERCAWISNKSKHLLFIRLLDFHVGLPLTAKMPTPEMFMRRRYYGQAGEFRPQQYPDGSVGLEYRTPASGQLDAEMFRMGLELFSAMDTIAEGGAGAAVRRAINTGRGLTRLTVKEVLSV